jgi:thiamine biosynthesis lipoprotein
MGTVVTFDFASLHPQLDAQLAKAQDSLRTADEVFSLWKPQSPMSQLRRGELDLQDAPLRIREVLDYCTVAKEMSGGWFDPWALPNGLDPTGFVKGWAAEVAAGYFTDLDLTGVIVNAAGDIVASGTNAEGEPLLAGILSAAEPNRLSASVVGPNLGMADAFATAVVCGGRDAYDVIADLDDYEVFVQYYDGSTTATPNFPFDAS